MSECLYFNVQMQILKSREISQNPPPDQHIKIPYCTHRESPAPLDLVTKVIGGARILQCEGMFAKCQIPGGYRP